MQIPSSLHCDRPPLRCVVDPLLAFKKYGAPLVRQISKGMEFWIARELWHILNNIKFYLHQPGLLNPAVLFSHPQLDHEYGLLQETLLSLLQWEELRLATDLSRLHLFWLGDSLKESFLPLTIETSLFKHWESLAYSLDHHFNQYQVKEHILSFALRDTIALTASLDSAFILTYQPQALNEDNPCPEICKVLAAWGIPCQGLATGNPIVALERDALRQIFVATNAAKFLWEGIKLAVLHLLVPTIPSIHIVNYYSQLEAPLVTDDSISQRDYTDRVWMQAKGFWYLL